MPKNDKACWTVSWIQDFTHLRLLLATTAPGALFCDFGRPKLMDDTMLERNGVQLTTRARQLKCRSVKKEIWTFPLCDLHESRCNFEPPKKNRYGKRYLKFALLHLFVYLNIQPSKMLESSKVRTSAKKV